MNGRFSAPGPNGRYDGASIVLHWTIALLILIHPARATQAMMRRRVRKSAEGRRYAKA
jgi:cytochrome b561